jgi:hypothetical protein
LVLIEEEMLEVERKLIEEAIKNERQTRRV